MSYIGNTPFTAAFLTDTFSGDGSDTTFTLSAAPANTSSIIVAVTGVLQDPSTYSVSGTTLTFSAAPPSGTDNISVRFLGIPASGVSTTAYRTVTEFTATAGQTSFSVPSYTVGYVDVYRNGVMLGTSDFTASSGTTIVLASGATAGDLIRVESFYVSSVLNAIPAVAGAVNNSYLGALSTITTPSGVLTVPDETATLLTSASDISTQATQNVPAFSVRLSASYTGWSLNTETTAPLDLEELDSHGWYNTSTYKFTPQIAGWYQIHFRWGWGSGSVQAMFALIRKNGTNIAEQTLYMVSAGTIDDYYPSVSRLVYLNGSTDYIDFAVYQVGGTAQIGAALNATNAFGFLVRAD